MSQAPSKKFSDAPEVSFFNGILNARATASYGFSCCPIWDENNLVHRNEKRYWDSWEGVWRCQSINWIIKKVRTCAPFSSLAQSSTLFPPCHVSIDAGADSK
jgi:hypothetical protein